MSQLIFYLEFNAKPMVVVALLGLIVAGFRAWRVPARPIAGTPQAVAELAVVAALFAISCVWAEHEERISGNDSGMGLPLFIALLVIAPLAMRWAYVFGKCLIHLIDCVVRRAGQFASP